MKTITLANLETATPQEVFDQVAKHLLTQKKRSQNAEETCVYLNPFGLKCAAGCLIAPKEYNPEWECSVWDSLVEAGAVPAAHSHLICALQSIHDGNLITSWRYELKELAVDQNLEWRFG